ncbi:DUF4350 domain-containing protein, partial [Escherichia coli]|uniref:DUF4350 domain-containing protein n=1 Tax=Escherichia coli TaxID=562 RepID=UPI0019551C63
PFEDLASKNTKTPIILLRVNSSLQSETYSAKEEDWVKTGNLLVLLGVREPVTKAAFSSQHNTEFGMVKIDTQRRKQSVKDELLRDSFGAIVWERKVGKGTVIYCSTPHLAANAYQDYPGNYEFLAQLVTPHEQPIWVDEYS